MAILQNTDLRILIVDDQDSVRLVLAEQLIKMGVREVVQARSAIEAIEMFAAHKPDIVLLDIQMPGHSGHWIAEQIRNMDGGHWTPIIFLTGLDSDEDLWEGIRVGGDDYLIKPVRSTVLAAKLRAMQRLLTMQRRLVSVTEELYEANKRLNSLIERDALTGLINRRGFDRILHEQILLARRHQVLASRGIVHPASSVSGVVTVSGGITTCVPDEQTSNLGMVTRADEALYAAKAQGAALILGARWERGDLPGYRHAQGGRTPAHCLSRGGALNGDT
eukprot:gene39382-48671_t